jgi:formylglycine-generating enzyme required for sulfatase activity
LSLAWKPGFGEPIAFRDFLEGRDLVESAAMSETPPPQKPHFPVSGYDFASAVLSKFPEDGVQKLLDYAGGESDWLEKKAAVYLRDDDPDLKRLQKQNLSESVFKKERDYLEIRLCRKIAESIVALYNMRGGVLFIGIGPSTNNPVVPFRENDRNGFLGENKDDFENYLRQAVIPRIWPKDFLFREKQKHYRLIPDIRRQNWGSVFKFEQVQFMGETILATLVMSRKQDVEPLCFSVEPKNGKAYTQLPYRAPGAIGEVMFMRISNEADKVDFQEDIREPCISASDLETKAKQFGISVSPIESGSESDSQPSDAKGNDGTSEGSDPRGPRRRYWLYFLSFAIVVLIVALLVVFSLQPPPPPPNILTIPLDKGREIRLVECPPGQFTMGGRDNEHRNSNETRQIVEIGNRFWVGETEVTQGQWDSVEGGGTVSEKAEKVGKSWKIADVPGVGSKWPFKEYSFKEFYGRDPKGECGPDEENAPMYFVSWDDAVKFCEDLNGKLEQEESLRPLMTNGYAFRLPDEAEWEYFARAGVSSDYPNGKDIQGSGERSESVLDAVAWYSGNAGNSGTNLKPAVRPVGGKDANAWGIHDVSGNVWEWCRDACDFNENDHTGWPTSALYKVRLALSHNDERGFKSDSKTNRHVIRGGGWSSSPKECRLAYRGGLFSRWGRNDVGFRVVLAPTNRNWSVKKVGPDKWSEYCAEIDALHVSFEEAVTNRTSRFQAGLNGGVQRKFEEARKTIEPIAGRLSDKVVELLIKAWKNDKKSTNSSNLVEFVQKLIGRDFSKSCRAACGELVNDGNELEADLGKAFKVFFSKLQKEADNFDDLPPDDRRRIKKNEKILFSKPGSRLPPVPTRESFVKSAGGKIAVDIEDYFDKVDEKHRRVQVICYFTNELAEAVSRTETNISNSLFHAAEKAKNDYLEIGAKLFEAAKTKPSTASSP